MKLLALIILQCTIYSVTGGACRVFNYGQIKMKDLPEWLSFYFGYDFRQHHAELNDIVDYYEGFPNGDDWTICIVGCYKPTRGSPRYFCRNYTIAIGATYYESISRKRFAEYWDKCKKTDDSVVWLRP